MYDMLQLTNMPKIWHHKKKKDSHERKTVDMGKYRRSHMMSCLDDDDNTTISTDIETGTNHTEETQQIEEMQRIINGEMQVLTIEEHGQNEEEPKEQNEEEPKEQNEEEPMPELEAHAENKDQPQRRNTVHVTNTNKTFIDDELALIRNHRKFSKMISDAYYGTVSINSTTLDIISIYLKGQKILFVESKTYCEQCLYTIMLPTIFISTLCTVLSPGLSEFSFNPILISSLTAMNSFMLALITYLKLDAKAEAHKTTAYHFDKLQLTCEFYAGKILLVKDADMEKNVSDFIKHVETKVNEIKETNQFIIPEIIRYRYAKIYSYNVFTELKRYKTEHTKNIAKTMRTFCEIEQQLPRVDTELWESRKVLINKLINYRNIAYDLNKEVYDEIEKYEVQREKNRHCMCLKT